MSLINNFVSPGIYIVSRALYNRVCQSQSIQELSTGMAYLRHAKNLLWVRDPSPNRSLGGRIGRKAVGVVYLIVGSAGLISGVKRLTEASMDDLRAEFLIGQKPGRLERTDEYEYQFSLMQRVQERVNDGKDRHIEVLYLSAGSETDPYGALNPSLEIDRHHESDSKIYSLPYYLNKICNVTYRVIPHPLQMCAEIQSVSRSRRIDNLVIGAHGQIDAMGFSRTSRLRVFDQLPADCFAGLASNARIFLVSCSTGAFSLLKPNLAEWISWISQREVIAAFSQVTADRTKPDINPDDDRLDITFFGRKHFNTSTSRNELVLFLVKLIAPGVLGATVVWQTMRLGATVLQATGAATEWIVAKSAAPTRRLAEKTGLYNPVVADILYTAINGFGQILNTAGKRAHRRMDRLIQPVSNFGGGIFWGVLLQLL